MKATEQVKILFEDMSISSSYQLLEWGKDSEELKAIASKRGIQVPSKDLSIFKCKYAMVDEQNRNKCTLPRKEVKRALASLNAKAIDKDHLRKATIGHWLDAELDDNDIIAYGCFWKSNFPEEYEEIKQKMTEGKVKISFEAWGDRIFKEDGSYNLTNIEFAGGAFLFETEPAFPGAEVMEFSNRVLEFAKVIDQKSEGQLLEEAKLDFNSDVNNIARIVYQHECPTCKQKGWQDVQNIDFENSKIKHKCLGCGQITETDLTPQSVVKKSGKKPKPPTSIGKTEDVEDKEEIAMIDQLEGAELIGEDNKIIEDAKKLTYKERTKIDDDMFAVVVTNKDGKKVRMFPVHDPAHVRNALARLPQATETLNKLGISPETVKKKILKRAKELNMTELLKRHDKGGISTVDEIMKKYSKASIEDVVKFLETEIDTAKASITSKDQEIATLKTDKDTVTAELATIKASLVTVKEEAKVAKEALDAKLAAEKAALITARKAELGEEFAKDLKDEDILDETKYELAKTKKELALAKAEKPTKGGLEAGAAGATGDPVFDRQNKIQKHAFGENK